MGGGLAQVGPSRSAACRFDSDRLQPLTNLTLGLSSTIVPSVQEGELGSHWDHTGITRLDPMRSPLLISAKPSHRACPQKRLLPTIFDRMVSHLYLYPCKFLIPENRGRGEG